MTLDPSSPCRIAVVQDEPRDILRTAERAWSEVIRAAVGAPSCFDPFGLAVFTPHPDEARRGVAVVVHLPALHLTAAQVATVTRFARHLTAPPEAEIVAAACARADRDALERAVLEAAAARVRARAAKAASSYVADNERWWAADRAENEATERLDRAAAEWVEREGRRG